MLDFYNFVENNPKFRQFNVDELLFTAYDCPIEESPLDYWVEKNYFCYVFRGGAKWKTPNEEYLLEIGDAAFLRKGAHRVFKILTGEFCALLIFLPDEFINDVVKNDIPINQKTFQVQHTDSVIPLVLDQSLSDYFNTVLNYFSQPSPPPRSLLKIKFKELIINIMTSNNNPLVSDCFMEICHSNKSPLKQIMEENFVFNLKLEDFAKLCGRSLSTFNRDFRKIYNTTPGKWLAQKRLEYGKHLLEFDDKAISEVAFDSGFESSSHFIRVFRQHFEVTPLQFKKQYSPA